MAIKGSGKEAKQIVVSYVVFKTTTTIVFGTSLALATNFIATNGLGLATATVERIMGPNWIRFEPVWSTMVIITKPLLALSGWRLGAAIALKAALPIWAKFIVFVPQLIFLADYLRRYKVSEAQGL